MAEDYRVTIRLSPELAAQLQARGCHGQPVAAIVRQALVAYLARQPETAETAPVLADTVAAMAARLDALHGQVEHLAARLDLVAAERQPVAARGRQPVADVAASPRQAAAATTAPPADPPAPQPRPRGQRKLTPRQIRALRAKRARGTPIKGLLEDYGVSKATLFRYLHEA